MHSHNQRRTGWTICASDASASWSECSRRRTESTMPKRSLTPQSQLAADRGWDGSGWASELWHALGWINYLRADPRHGRNLSGASRAIRLAPRRRGRCNYPDDHCTCRAPSGAGPSIAKALLDLADSRLPADRERYVFVDYIDAEQVRCAIDAGELRLARERLAGEAIRPLAAPLRSKGRAARRGRTERRCPHRTAAGAR